jgi:hypothetical protein
VAITRRSITIVIRKNSLFEDSSVVVEAGIKNQANNPPGITTITMTAMSTEDLTMTLHVATTMEHICGCNAAYRTLILLTIVDSLTLTMRVATSQDMVILVLEMEAATIGPGRMPVIPKMLMVI